MKSAGPVRAGFLLVDVLSESATVDAPPAPTPDPAFAAPHAPRRPGRRVGRAGMILLLGLSVALAFDYFGRPPLVIQGMFNTGSLGFGQPLAGYELGAPVWGWGAVTYPVTYRRVVGADCRGGAAAALARPGQWMGARVVGGSLLKAAPDHPGVGFAQGTPSRGHSRGRPLTIPGLTGPATGRACSA